MTNLIGHHRQHVNALDDSPRSQTRRQVFLWYHYEVRRKLRFCTCPARVRTTATLVWVQSKQTELMATIASKTCLLGHTSQLVSQTRTCPREITRGDDNNKDGGSAIRKTENGFIFLIYWLFAVSDRPSCPHQVLLAVMFTHRSPSQSFLASYW